MEISDLLGRLKGIDKDKPKPFLALEITDEVVVAAVWQVEGGKTNIISLGTPVEWDGENGTSEDLVKAVDATISNALEGLAEEPSEVIFGVANSWAGEAGVLPEKLKFLKNVCQELELKPLGFVVVTDSLLRYLKMQEGTPATCLLVQVNTEEITITLVKLGRVEGVEVVGRGDDISADVEEGLSRFKASDELPSRILVYNNMHSLEEEVQNLISYDWKSEFNFLHIPKIESLPKDILIRSIAVAGGSEVAKAIGFDITEEVVEPVEAKPKAKSKTAPDLDNLVPVKETIEEVGLVSAEDFGFASPDKKPRPAKAEKPLASHLPVAAKITLEPDEPLPVKSPPAPSSSISLPKWKIPAVKLPQLPNFSLLPQLSRLSFGKPAIILGGLFMVVLVFALSAIWLVPKATVRVYVEPKDLDENVDLVLDTAATLVDQANATVPAQAVEKTVTGEETVETTGKKTIGDPAKGQVVVYNRSSATKTFAKGATLTASSLKFTFDEAVTVASKSAGADYVDVPGRATAKITAKAIGTESNLPAGTEFTIENFAKDTYVAKNDQALSGGTSREVQVVDKADKTNVSQALLAKLREEGKSQILSEQVGGFGVYIKEKGHKLEEERYSAEVGEEASALTASYKLMVSGVSYSTHDVESLLASEIEKAMPSGYKRTLDPPAVELGEVKAESDSSIEVSAKVTVKLLPVVDEQVVKQSLRGVGSGEIEQNLAMVVGFKNAAVEITPSWLPARFKRMPRNPNNIAVEVLAAP